PRHEDELMAVAPYMAKAVPLNVGACAFADGAVSVHAPSVQLIGLPECTEQRFGYCGNDFGAVAALERAGLDTLDTMVRSAGRWLVERGYRGAFGLDALIDGPDVLLTEINPRFQGSSLFGAE